MIRDRDKVYGTAVTRRLRTMGIRDKPIAPGSPWQNGFAERLIGSIRRECVDHDRPERSALTTDPDEVRLLTTTIGLAKALRFIVPSSTKAASHRSRSWVAFTIVIVESEFSVQTGAAALPRAAHGNADDRISQRRIVLGICTDGGHLPQRPKAFV